MKIPTYTAVNKEGQNVLYWNVTNRKWESDNKFDGTLEDLNLDNGKMGHSHETGTAKIQLKEKYTSLTAQYRMITPID